MTDRVVHVGPDGEMRQLPAGERVLWSGGPDRRSLARFLLRERWVMGFVALTWALQVSAVLQRDTAVMQRLVGVTVLTAALALVALATVRVFAWQIARTSKYVITDRRIYFNIGVVLRADANIPYSSVDGVDLVRRPDGSADVMVTMAPKDEIPWLLLFPHIAWRGSQRGRPTLRGVRNPQDAADALTGALRAYAAVAGVDATVVPTAGPAAPLLRGSTGVATPFPA